MKFYELLILVFGCLSALDLIRWKITKKANEGIISMLEILGDYKTSFKIKQVVEKILVLVCIVYLIWKLFM